MSKNKIINIAVIGGGPAGIMAAYSASLNPDTAITIFERNEKLGKKLYITGKGRCNLTNAGDANDFFKNITRNEKFFYSAFYTFDNFTLMSTVEQEGTPLKTERGNRVFPVSEKSSDILKALKKLIDKNNIQVNLNIKVEDIKKQEDKFIINSDDIKLYDKVIIAGGGKTYPVTGSDGTTYEIAKKLGHTVTPLQPGLCGIETSDFDTQALSGLSLKNVILSVIYNKKQIFSSLGEMEFTHYGISGPIVLSASSIIEEDKITDYKMSIDLKSGLDESKLKARIIRDVEAEPNKEIKNTLGKLLPIRLMQTIFNRCGIDDSKKSNQLTKDERNLIINNLKSFDINPVGLRPIGEAIITRGGVSCGEINPSTMESKIIEGLYFAGEILDLDAMTGGYNLQIAFSTGYLAGLSASE